jgi:hypothetical protein
MAGYNISVGESLFEISSVSPSVNPYNLTANVVRMTKTNGALGITETPVIIVTAMPCSIKWLGGKESIKFNKETHTLDAVLECRVPAGITIVVTDMIYYNSLYYEIVNIKDVNNLGVLLQIAIKKIK